jgi:hypothetical protein
MANYRVSTDTNNSNKTTQGKIKKNTKNKKNGPANAFYTQT